MAKNLKIYYYPCSPVSRSVIITAELLNLDFEKELVDLLKGEHLTEEFAKINPCQSVPALIDDGISFRESRAIMTYLVQKYSPNNPLYPSNNLLKRTKIDEALYFDCGHIFGSIIPLMHSAIIEKKKPTEIQISLVEKNLNKLEKTLLLAGTKFLVGNELTLADISTITNITSMQRLEIFDFNSKPKILEWIDNVKSQIEKSWNEQIIDGAESLKKLVDHFLSQN